ncbi:hypothetical protein [Acidovorax sp. NCPPB 3576]|uniref:hypothetical protein n=1 Tax=Acidovorax sp. NCPPB 3576 TaxID=2940488 RepID=UPI00234BB013|nr:hypothetical protein [Acidovorax sp. NCPPB 3576]WCM86668.1 hypothetical protein M5C98_14905 [Acidovorax sp. NCPPB 3576]
MTIALDRPTIAERLTSAGNSSDLTVSCDARGDVDLLIAAGSTTASLGRYVYQLMTEWDACAKPRVPNAADIERLAEHLPRIKVEKRNKRGVRQVEALDLQGAIAEADAWLIAERRQVLGRLRSLPKLTHPHSGLLPWVVAQGYTSPDVKLLDVLGWWADRRCPVCSGTKVRDGRVCKVCRGVGERDIPHGREGQTISEHIAMHVDRARQGVRSGLSGLNRIKAYAAARDGCRTAP